MVYTIFADRNALLILKTFYPLMTMNRRTLFNAIRMNKEYDPSIRAKEWQLWDYRAFSLDKLFSMLAEVSLFLDRDSFIAYAEHFDTPEELTEAFVEESETDSETEEKIYPLLFELWRRIVPEKRCLSLFCDELDTQIHAYDTGKLQHPEPLEDVLANFAQLLEENADMGEEPQELFAIISEGCANDIESFLYDFISECIDQQNEAYASELIDNFRDYVSAPQWFDILQARIIGTSNPEEADKMLRQLVKKASNENDIDFSFELLSLLVQEGDERLFIETAKNTIPLLEIEEDLLEILALTADYYRCLDNDYKEEAVNHIIEQRNSPSLAEPVKPSDPDIKALLKVFRMQDKEKD
ncbi:MAG: hypothetical protein Tsb0021_09910 [Chlamydiales bacterium]